MLLFNIIPPNINDPNSVLSFIYSFTNTSIEIQKVYPVQYLIRIIITYFKTQREYQVCQC